METEKKPFSDIKGMLSRDQMKQIKGGSGCCAHTAGWTSSQCGYSSAGEAQAAASYAAYTYGVQTFWCCQSC